MNDTICIADDAHLDLLSDDGDITAEKIIVGDGLTAVRVHFGAVRHADGRPVLSLTLFEDQWNAVRVAVMAALAAHPLPF